MGIVGGRRICLLDFGFRYVKHGHGCCCGLFFDFLRRFCGGLKSASLPNLFPFGHTLDIQPPTGESGGQTGVLAFFTDSQRKLAVGHNHHRSQIAGEQFHRDDFRRAERFTYEYFGILVPRYDIDLFPLELVNDALDTVSPHPDAGAHRVDSRLGSADRHLAAEPRLPGDGFNLNYAVVNFRNLNLK